MSTKNTAKQSNGANAVASKTKKTAANKAAKITSVTKNVTEHDEPSVTNNEAASDEVLETVNTAEPVIVKAESPTKGTVQTAKAKSKNVSQKKPAGSSKSATTNNKKIRLATTSYHYYRNWLAEFLRSHGVLSARFQKASEGYNGHITVLESEKAKGIKALELWNKQNPEVKELFTSVTK